MSRTAADLNLAVIRVRLRPTASYGNASPKVTFSSHSIRFRGADLAYRMTTDGPLTFVLGDDEPITEASAAFGRSMLERTRRYWETWVRGLAIPADYQQAIIRAAITLKLCTFEDIGAVLAALMTSIPEAPDGVRNWDYRFCISALRLSRAWEDVV